MLATIALAALLQLPGPQAPASPGEFAPGTTYDAAIPTIQSVVGHEVWEVVTPPDQVVRYFEVLAEAAPDRTHLVHYADSWEGRPLVIMVIGSPERIASLDAIKADLARLAHPEGLSDAEADELIAGLPVVTALMHSIHGNEISPSGAAMMEAYHLLAAQNDPNVDLIFAESLVLIDPIENPDGRNRFVQENTMAAAVRPNVEAYSAEHDERWPGGRVNHYLFDLNRDLFIQSQVETRGKVRIFLEYWPHIVADLHEMGGNATYFFPPTAPPENPWYGERQIALMDVFGRANAAAFDARGFAYFNREVYDLFYPGYVDMWPMNHGALGMTYEQASARALVLEQSDGDVLTYGDGVLHQFTAAMATAHTSAVNRGAHPARLPGLPPRGHRTGKPGCCRVRAPFGARPGDVGAAGAHAGAQRYRGARGQRAGKRGRTPAPGRGDLHRPHGPADAPVRAQPARPARAHGGGLPSGADRPALPARARPDLRPDRVEPVAALGRGGDHRRPPNRGSRHSRHGHPRDGGPRAPGGNRRLPPAVGHQRGRRGRGSPARRRARAGRRRPL